VRDTSPPPPADRSGDVVLGDDWVAPDSTVEKALRDRRSKRRWFSFRISPLTRKIVTFNLIALNILAAGILYLGASRDGLVAQRGAGLSNDAALIADVFEVQLEPGAPATLARGDGIDLAATLDAVTVRAGVDMLVFDADRTIIAEKQGAPGAADPAQPRTIISDFLVRMWSAVSPIVSGGGDTPALDSQLRPLVQAALDGQTAARTDLETASGSALAAAAPILLDGRAIGVVVTISAAGEIDALVRSERERVLQMFIVATLVSIGLSLVLASTISNPLSDLAEAAELGRDRDARKKTPGRIRIPDLTARPDEIGRLSGALRGMVSALYNRIDSNEQFAADVAHEIKNPLASLRSAVGTLRMVKREDQRDKLLDVIEHDVRRLDRLVSDISNASRLDSELVKEEEEPFNLLKMLGNLNQYLGEDAKSKGIEYIADLPDTPILIHGLEARLAQVFVNLITNAISFCEDGDAIRVWVRKRENRVLVVVEDTGPGIPEQALTKIFKRFYSQRPDEHFGNNSGLGLAISKQIVEAHGGVIWAENIRPTAADVTSEPLGARFVVGLPV
jgi:two-component system sensor histidine kinase ChvG